MITSALLFAAGAALGWRYNLSMILFASVIVAVAFAAQRLMQAQVGWLDLLILVAHLTAVQGGFLVGGYIRSGNSDR